MNTTQKMMLLASACGATIGSATTYLVVHNRLSKHFEAIAEKEIDQVKNTYKRLEKNREYSSPTELVEALGTPGVEESRAISAEQGYSLDDEVEAFRSTDFEAEEAERARTELQRTLDEAKARREAAEQGGVSYPAEHDPAVADEYKPSIISVEEWHDDMNREKLSITYYAGDKTLVDDTDDPIPDIEGLLGPDALDNFGHLSSDPEIVYVRNPRIDVDYEVTLDQRSYSDMILGIRGVPDTRNVFDEEKRELRRMRDDG